MVGSAFIVQESGLRPVVCESMTFTEEGVFWCRLQFGMVGEVPYVFTMAQWYINVVIVLVNKIVRLHDVNVGKKSVITILSQIFHGMVSDSAPPQLLQEKQPRRQQIPFLKMNGRGKR